MVTILGRIGHVVVILLALIGIVSVVLRFALTVQYLRDPSVIERSQAAAPNAEPSPGPAGPEFDKRYYDHPYLTLVHIVPGFLFMTLGPLQFMTGIRKRWLRFHRWCGRVFLISSLAVALSALVILPVLPIFGTFTARVALLFGATIFLFSIVKGYIHIRRREIAQHREWMIRTFAVGLGISTLRLLLPVMIMLGASFVEAWDTVVWLGFGVNLVVAEIWINITRPQTARPKRAAPRETLVQTREMSGARAMT
jgi:uncharacterized membrane protein